MRSIRKTRNSSNRRVIKSRSIRKMRGGKSSKRSYSKRNLKRKSSKRKSSKRKLNKRKQSAGGCGCNKGNGSIYGAGNYWASNMPRPF